MAEKRKVYKSAETGEFVSEEYAEANPDTTYATTIEVELDDTQPIDAVTEESPPPTVADPLPGTPVVDDITKNPPRRPEPVLNDGTSIEGAPE